MFGAIFPGSLKAKVSHQGSPGLARAQPCKTKQPYNREHEYLQDI